MPLKVFISYTRDSAQQARRLSKALQKWGFQISLNPWQVSARNRLIQQFDRQKLKKHPGVMLYSPKSLQKTILRESTALAEAAGERRHPIVSVVLGCVERIGDVQTPGVLIDLRKVRNPTYRQRIEQIANALRTEITKNAYYPDLDKVHPVGSGVGMAAGAAAGTAVGTAVGGPVLDKVHPAGSGVGAAAGAATGAAVGTAVGGPILDKVHPVGSGVGAAAGAATGAAVGTAVGGPVGTLVGAVVGGGVGGLVGHAVAEGVKPTEEDNYWRENYRTRPYVDANRSYDDYRPAYQYGWESRSRYGNHRWEEAESDLERGWEKVKGATSSTWNEAKQAAYDAWHRASKKVPIEPLPRYADLTLYEEDRVEKVPTGHALRAEQRYWLEVAVRSKETRTGIPYKEGEEQPAIRETDQQTPVTIWVVAEGEDGFKISHPVQKLVLPPKGDSTENAWFEVEAPEEPSKDAESLARIKINLLYEFNLLEDVTLHVEVVDSKDARSRLKLKSPIYLKRTRELSNYLDLENVRPRLVTILIDKEDGEFELRFQCRNAAGAEVVFPAKLRLKNTDLEHYIVSVREIWQDIALSEVFQSGLEGGKFSFIEQIRRLAENGQALWRVLFLLESQGAMASIGEWLKTHPPEDHAILQIHLSSEASDFVLPWALLYDRELPERKNDPIELDGFWGVRHRIEQLIPTSRRGIDKAVPIEMPFRIGFMLWDRFPHAKEQVELMRNFTRASAGKLVVSDPPVKGVKDCYQLMANGDHQILYFYSHGYTRPRKEGDVGTEFGKSLVERYEKLTADSPIREALKLVYDAVQEARSEYKGSYIKLTDGKLYLNELLQLSKLPGQPLVVLNMCESAQLTPMFSESFVHFFLDRGAAAVLGTECPMTVEFAHPFAEAFLRGLLRGEEVGEALLRARRKFLELRNPLGLAYTLYGRDTLAFTPPCLPLEDTTAGLLPS